MSTATKKLYRQECDFHRSNSILSLHNSYNDLLSFASCAIENTVSLCARES